METKKDINYYFRQKKANIQDYELIKIIGFDKYGQYFLISYNIDEFEEKQLYAMAKLEIKSNKFQLELTKKLEILKNINSYHINKIYDYYFKNEEGKDFAFILMDYCEKGNLYHIIYGNNYLNQRTILRIFIQIIQGLKFLNLNNIFLEILTPSNIFLDKNNNVKIGIFDIIYDFKEEYLFHENEDILSYLSPEILNGFPYNDK